MTNTNHSTRGKLRGGAALSALALLGAGLVATVATPTPAAAQDYTNVTASGRVQGTNGQPISGATVVLRSNDQGFERTVTTGPDGAYRVPQIPPGEYTITVSAPGFQTFSDPGVAVEFSSSSSQFTLAPETASDDDLIVVTAGRIEIADFERTTTGTVVEIGELATRVPVARDLTSVIQLSPGTSQGDTAFGNLPSIAGSSVAENVYYINGLNITSFRKGLGAVTVPFEFYETVEIKNGGYQAEFGRSTGGVVNSTTKSGSNEFHAGMLFSYEPDEFQADSPNTLTQDNDSDFSERIDANFYVSGPIIEDRLFFYGLYNSRFVKTGDGSLSSGQYTTQKTDSPFYGLKLDGIVTDGHRVEFTYFDTSGVTTQTFNQYDTETNEIGEYSSTTLARYGGKNFVGRYTGTFTDWLTLSAAYGKNKNRDTTESSSPDYPFIRDSRNFTGDPNFTPSFIGNLTNVQERAFDTREFYRADADVYFEAFGSHHIRFGYDRENLSTTTENNYTGGVFYDLFYAPNGSQNFRDNGVPLEPGAEYVTARTFEGAGTFNTKNEAFYIQDSWSLFDNRLNLQLGIRNDRFENSNIDGEVFYSSGDQWGPRLGFTADPFGDGLTKVYGSFGRYFLPIAANTNLRLAGAEYDVTTYYRLLGLNPDNTPILGNTLTHPALGPCIRIDANACSVTATGETALTETTVSKNLQPQSLDEYILGIEHRLGSRLTVGIYGTYRSLNSALEDVAIDQAVNAYCETEFGVDDYSEIAGCDAYTGFHQYVLVNPGAASEITLDPLNGEAEGRTVLFTGEQLGYPKARRTYKAITATVDREFDGVWSLAGSYTWSKTQGNYEGAVKSDNGQDDAGITQDFDQPGLVPGAYGYLPGDRRHNFKLYGSYQVTDWFLFGANFQMVSPRKFGCIGRVPIRIDPYAWRYGAAGNYCPLNANGELDTTVDDPESPAFVLVPRGTAFESDWQSFTNLTFAFTLPTDAFDGQFRVDVFNVFNQKAEIDFNEFGTDDQGFPAPDYRAVTGYQPPRYFRFQLGLRF